MTEKEFLKEYKELCKKYNFYLDISNCDGLCLKNLKESEKELGYSPLHYRILKGIAEDYALVSNSEKKLK